MEGVSNVQISVMVCALGIVGEVMVLTARARQFQAANLKSEPDQLNTSHVRERQHADPKVPAVANKSRLLGCCRFRCRVASVKGFFGNKEPG